MEIIRNGLHSVAGLTYTNHVCNVSQAEHRRGRKAGASSDMLPGQSYDA